MTNAGRFRKRPALFLLPMNFDIVQFYPLQSRKMPFLKTILTPKLIVFFLALLIVILVAGFYFYRSGPGAEKKTFLPCPVPDQYCKTAEVIPGSWAFGFHLPVGTEIKAVTTGIASKLKSSFKDNVVELRSSSGSAIYYIFQSDFYINFAGPVDIGFVLGKAGDSSKGYPGYNLVIQAVDQKGNYYKDVRGLFKP